MKSFIYGVLTMGFVVAALFFVRFFRQTRDRLFAWFSVAFAFLAIHQVALLFTDERSEARTGVYVVRLLAFAIILWAIVDKNRAAD